MKTKHRRNCGIAVALAVAIGSGILFTTVRRDIQSAEKATTPKPYDHQVQATALRRHNEIKAAAATSSPKVLFLGDSLTERWESEGMEPWNRRLMILNPFNAGIDSDRTENLLWRVQDGGLDFTRPPEVCVLLIGINNLAADGDTPYGVARGVEAVARKLLSSFPETRVVIVGLLPAGPHSNTLVGKRVRTNRKLEGLELPRTTYLDVSDAFLNKDGGARSGLTTDGLHLSEEGYSVLAETLARQLNILTK